MVTMVEELEWIELEFKSNDYPVPGPCGWNIRQPCGCFAKRCLHIAEKTGKGSGYDGK